jgi:hypothetical protein
LEAPISRSANTWPDVASVDSATSNMMTIRTAILKS